MKLYVFAILLLITNFLFCQTMWDETLSIRQGGDLEWGQASVTTENNEIVHVWSENAIGVNDIFAMKYDNQGNPLWGDEALLIDNSNNIQAYPKIISTNDGGVVIIWLTYSSQTSIMAQKLDASGNKLWSESGITISNNYQVVQPNRIVLFPNEIGGAIVTWVDYDTIAQNLDSNGVNQWNETENGLDLGFIEYNNQITSDGHGGLIIVASDGVSLLMSLRRIDTNGEILWSENVELDSPQNDRSKLRIIYNNVDSYYLILEEFDYPDTDLSVRKISLTGELGTTMGYIPLTIDTAPMYFIQFETNNNGDLIVVSQSVTSYEDDQYSLIAYCLDQDLNPQWGESGIFLDSLPYLVVDSVEIETSDSGDVFITNVKTNEESTNAPAYNVYLFKLNLDGSLETDQGGLLVAQNQGPYPTAFLAYEDDLFITWKDNLDGYKNLRQKIIDDNLQIINLPENEIVINILTGSVFNDSYKVYSLPNSNRSVVIWIDNIPGMNKKIKYQIINSEGNYELAENGVDLANFSLYGQDEFEYSPEDFTSAQNEAGQICVAWKSDFLGIVGRSRVIDSDGSLLGSNIGEEIYGYGEYEQVLSMLMGSYNNDFYLSFLTANYGLEERDIYTTKTSNSFEWGEINHVQSFLGELDFFNEFDTVINNYCIVRHSNQAYQAFKIGEDGSVFEINQMLTGYNSKFACDADNNLFFTWQDGCEIYLQGLTNNQDLFWNEPILVNYDSLAGKDVVVSNPEILISNGIFVTWNKTMDNYGNDLLAQKISYSGQQMWNSQGVLLTNLEYSYEINSLIETDNDNILVGWTNQFNFFDSPIFNVVNSNGSVIFEATNEMIIDSPYTIYNLQVCLNPDDQLLCTWVTTGGIYAQLYDLNTVENESNQVDARTLNLNQNYPNPFNPITNISFYLPKPSQVSLDIYNIKGQKVKNLVDNRLEAGRHTLVWNGKDNRNKRVASGIYLYKITSDRYSSTKKMILMK